MSQNLAFAPPGFNFQFTEEAGGLAVSLPRLPLIHLDLEQNQFIYALATPTQLNSSFNPSTDTDNGANATVAKNMDGFSSFTRGYFLSFTARIAADPSAELVANHVSLFFGSHKMGQIYVDATTQQAGALIMIAPASSTAAGDTRFLLDDTGAAVTSGTIEADDNIYSKATHGFETGDRLTLNSLTGGTGVTAGQIYFFHKLTSGTGYLCSTLAAALAGTAINVTLDATNVSLTKQNAVGFSLSTAVDPNLVLDLRLLATDA